MSERFANFHGRLNEILGESVHKCAKVDQGLSEVCDRSGNNESIIAWNIKLQPRLFCAKYVTEGFSSKGPLAVRFVRFLYVLLGKITYGLCNQLTHVFLNIEKKYDLLQLQLLQSHSRCLKICNLSLAHNEPPVTLISTHLNRSALCSKSNSH